jgi:hypothetical protein
LQLIVAPSFEPVSVWDIWESFEWQLIHPRVIDTAPTLLVVGHDVVPVPSTELVAYFTRVTAITLPLRPDLSGSLGLDGTMYELAVAGDSYSGWRFQWWSEWPEQWRPLVELANEMHAAFSAAASQDADRGAATDRGNSD